MIPETFLLKMQALLGADFPAFLAALEAPPKRAIRVNTQKISVENFLQKTKLPLQRIPYAEDGFYLEGEEKLGGHPHHHAGIFYSQDPGAMSTVNALRILPGWRVLDACASPGGKSAQIAARIGDAGILVSNEISLPRCKVLAGNLERQGFRNALVTNTDAKTLGGWFSGVFDLVLVDAPCSGEGMFRKYEYAAEEWSPEGVSACARRQREILMDLAQTVAPGGYLLYSTCTFSLEENEETVADFLKKNADFALCPIEEEVCRVTAAGIPTCGFSSEEAACMRRFYPHLAPGEGQFMALLRRASDAARGKGICYRDAAVAPGSSERKAVESFLADALEEKVPLTPMCVGDRVVLCDFPIPPKQVFSPGVVVGTLQKGRIEPHHMFFMAYGTAFRRKLCFSADAPEVEAYLRGETFSCPGAENGWTAVLVDGATLGGVKVVDGVAKNHYPKGLRQRT